MILDENSLEAHFLSQVLGWREEGRGRKMCSARPSWMSITPITLGYKERLYRVKLDEMIDILKVSSNTPSLVINLL